MTILKIFFDNSNTKIKIYTYLCLKFSFYIFTNHELRIHASLQNHEIFMIFTKLFNFAEK